MNKFLDSDARVVLNLIKVGLIRNKPPAVC